MTTQQRANNLNNDVHNSLRASLGQDLESIVSVNASIVAENIAFEREVEVLRAFKEILGETKYSLAYNRLKHNHTAVITELRNIYKVSVKNNK